MALFRGIQEYIALDANNITQAILLTSLAIYSCIPFKAIQYYLIVFEEELDVRSTRLSLPGVHTKCN